MPAPSEFRFIWKMRSEEAAFFVDRMPCATCKQEFVQFKEAQSPNFGWCGSNFGIIFGW